MKFSVWNHCLYLQRSQAHVKPEKQYFLHNNIQRGKGDSALQNRFDIFSSSLMYNTQNIVVETDKLK